ncbi:MAG: hypothetical protein ABIG11_00150 [bacterium]
MKKIISAVTLITGVAVSSSFAGNMNAIENAAADAAIAARSGNPETASGIADMAFSGSIALDDKGAVFVPAEVREEVKKDIAVKMDKKTGKKQPLGKKVPGFIDSINSPLEEDEFGFIRMLGMTVIAPVYWPILGGAVGAVMAENVKNPLLSAGAALLGVAVGIVLTPVAMAVTSIAALVKLCKGNVL